MKHTSVKEYLDDYEWRFWQMMLATLWKPLNTVKTELCAITCADTQFRAQRKVVELEVGK
jgi:hypothetical protein